MAHLKSLPDPTRFLFEMSDLYVGRWLSATMSVLFVTSVFAGLLAFHNASARYFYALGREGVLPAGLGRTHPRHSSPHVGSVAQTVIGATVVLIFAEARADPITDLDGRRMLDCQAGLWCVNVGHGRAEVNQRCDAADDRQYADHLSATDVHARARR